MEEATSNGFRYVDNLYDLLSYTRVESIPPEMGADHKWLVLDYTTTVEQALSLLQRNRLLSVPVKDAFGKCAGFVDVIDLLAYLVNSIPSSPQALTSPILLDRFKHFSTQQIGSLVDFGKRNPFVPVPKGQMLLALLQNLKSYATLSVHRVPIVVTPPESSEPVIVNIVTQSAMMRYIARHVSVLGEFGQRPIEQFFPTFPPLVSVQPHFKAIDAFMVIHLNRLSAVPVVDQQKRLVSNLSASDLRGLTTAHFHRLFLPVVDYIKGIYVDRKEIMTPPITAFPSTTLETLILKFAASRVHRIYVVDSASVALGVITLTDILQS